MINASIVGLGRWGRNLVEASLNHERFKIIRAVETEIDSARDFCTAHHLELFDNLDAVLADSNVDAVLLATPHSLHPAQVMACAAARKHVFCEKPLALHQADAARMFEASRKAGVTLAVGHNRRFWPAMTALRNVVASGKLGTMLGPVRRVYAQVNSHRQGPPPLDTAIVMLDFANGVTGTLATVRATPFLLARSRLRNEGLCRGIG